MLGPVQLGSVLFLCIQALLAIVCGMNPPSFVSTWISLVAQNFFKGEVTINHNFGEYPAKVEVQVKVTDKEQEYIFTGIGSAHRDNDAFGLYGGVIYIYNAEHVRLFVPVSEPNSEYVDRGRCAYTGGSNFTGSRTIEGQYTTCQVRVRAWRLSDIGNPAFKVDKIGVDDTINQFKELKHGLGVYPDLVSVQVKIENYISDAQGNVFATPTNLEIATGGVVFGYDENKIRLWVQGQSESVLESGGVFNLHHGWTGDLFADLGDVKIMMWTLSREDKVFNQTLSPFGIGIQSQTYDAIFPSPFSPDEHLITTEVLVHDGLNANYKFHGAGSCMGDGSQGLGQFGGVVYVYNAERVLLYRPADHTGGKLVFIGERWGNNENFQSSDTGSVTVNVFKLKGKQCYGPGKIGYASMSVTGTEKGDTVTYTCNIGYEVTEGNASRTCEANGHWSGSPPICTKIKCSAPVSEPHTLRYCGTYGEQYGDAYRYSCSYGYKRTSGDYRRTCTENGNWSGNPLLCSVKLCYDPGTVSNAKRILKGLNPRDTVQYTCNEGYYRSKGDLIYSCKWGGYWSGQRPTCTVKPCDKPADVVNANKVSTGMSVGDKVTYTCKSGFLHHFGNLERTCQLGGKWSGVNPICSKIGDATCKDPELIENTTRTVHGLTAGQKVLYQCISGFKITSGDLTLTCNNQGLWTGTPPICTRVQCPEAKEIPNGEMNLSGTYIDDKIVYTCKDNYYQYSGSTTRTCTSKGTWDGQSPVCKLTQCRNPFVQNAKQLPNTVSPTVTMINPGDNVTYLCNNGYTHSSGDLTLTCQYRGVWKGESPTCKAVECGDPGNVENADRVLTGTSYKKHVVYTCGSFFRLTSGNTFRECGSDGKWTGKAPTCSDNECPVPSPVPGAYIETAGTSFGSNITYRCLQGYELTGGSTVITCLPSKTWSNAGPKCTRITCFAPNVTANSTVMISYWRYGMIAKYICDPGFSMTSGDAVHYCESNPASIKYWSGSIPVCKESIILSDNALGNESLKEMVNAIKAKIVLPKKNTSLYKRSLTSAKDDRHSSMYIGATGACFLCLVVGTILFIDCLNYVHFRKRK